jgi:hypothetical protein
MRGKGINYDAGFFPGGKASRPDFDGAVVRRELEIIATDLHCDAVRISGGDLDRLTVAGRHAVEAGLEAWFSPFPAELTPEELIPYFAESAERAEVLRRAGGNVVLVAGCEVSVFAAGFLPGANAYERMAALSSGDPKLWASLADVPARLNAFLSEVASSGRQRFGGPITYAAAPWEPIDWSPFDIVSVDAYRDAQNADRYRSDVRTHLAHGKPVAVTEFGCCTYKGAADRGAMGWAIVDDKANPPRLRGDYVRDEFEQVRYMRELLNVFSQEGVDRAFWFTFAGYRLPHRPDPHLDLDMASFGLVRMVPARTSATYPGMPWEPKEAFHALAALKV